MEVRNDDVDGRGPSPHIPGGFADFSGLGVVVFAVHNGSSAFSMPFGGMYLVRVASLEWR